MEKGKKKWMEWKQNGKWKITVYKLERAVKERFKLKRLYA